MAKGGEFEREVCKTLSLWWTDCDSDAVFWRTSNSGGRATVRGKGKRKTVNQHGDITFTDPVGMPLLQALTFELKRGYSCTLQDLIDADKPPRTSYAAWIAQAKRSQVAAESLSWAIIHRRDRRVVTITMPEDMFSQLLRASKVDLIVPFAMVHSGSGEVLVTVRLQPFLSSIRPAAVREVVGKISQNSG
jgi:hypothetical protein